MTDYKVSHPRRHNNNNNNNNNNHHLNVKYKTKVKAVIIRAIGTISESFRRYLNNIPGKHNIKQP
jgi:DNA-directed RNA polymerase subunit L